MKIRQALEIEAGHRHAPNGRDEPLRIRLTLVIEGATRGDGVAGAIKELQDGARRQIVETLDRRPY